MLDIRIKQNFYIVLNKYNLDIFLYLIETMIFS